MKRINIRVLVASLTLILSLTLGAGCALLPSVDTEAPSSPPAIDNTTDNATPIDSEWSTPVTESQAMILPSIADVVAKVKPSVVAINTEVATLDFLNRPFTQEGAGSGWIIREDGIIITNNHVVKGAESITVTLDDGRTFPADMNTVATDWLTDLAVLKIDAENLQAASVGDSRKLRVGDWVVAIGNSLGQGIRATQGIVSRQDASLQVDMSQLLYGLIETDAAINPGNSGGPLVNMMGEVVGIASAKLASVEVEAVGYAISTEIAVPIIQQLINTGHAVHPWLGVSLYSVDEYVVERFSLGIDKGAFVVEVVDGSPASTAGLQPEDIIVTFAGEKIDTVDDLIQAIRSAQVGQRVEITYWRGGTPNTTHATLIERPTLPKLA
ncbi:Serine protease Do-like HtrB [subsurface metagenome]